MVKKMETDKRGRRKSVRSNADCFLEESLLGVSVLVTHQGFWRKALLWAIDNQIEYEIIDLRIKDLIPPPKLGMMRGFRFSQRDLLVQALSCGCSGLIGGPTRYGKSILLYNILRAWPNEQTVILLPGADLLKQMFRDVTEQIPDREVKLIGAGSRTKFQSEDITICSMDSIHKIDTGPVRILVVDEPHAVIADSRVDHIARFALARKYGLGATLTGRYDGRDFLLEGLIGPILAQRTYLEAVAEKAISPIKVMMVRWPVYPLAAGQMETYMAHEKLNRVNLEDRDDAYRMLVHKNELFGRCVRYLSDTIIPKDWQSLFFIQTEDQADYLIDWVGRDVSVAMAKKLTSKERDELTGRVVRDEIKRVLCTNIYVQGVTFSDLMCLVNCAGGGASTTTIQKPGRLAEIREGKNWGLLVDFKFELRPGGAPGEKIPAGVAAVIRDSSARLAAYHKIGYDVHIVERKDMQPWFIEQGITAPRRSKHQEKNDET